MELVLALAAFLVVDVLALRVGFDSRGPERDEVARMEREAGSNAWRA